MHAAEYLIEVAEIADKIPYLQIETMVSELGEVKGRIYCAGLGGSAANAEHMAADFRKLCGLDAWALANLAELTAWANDEGMEEIFAGVTIRPEDAVFVLSVGGGDVDVSQGLCRLIDKANTVGAKVFGIVGPRGGYAARHGSRILSVPAPEHRVTPHTEAFQAVLWHCLVSHPSLQKRSPVW